MITILVLEDDSQLRQALIEKLDGYKILSASNGKEGLALIQKTQSIWGLFKPKINCILLDMQMPELDGHQFLKALHDINGAQKIPVLICTALATTRDENLTKFCNYKGKLNKFAEAEELKLRIFEAMG